MFSYLATATMTVGLLAGAPAQPVKWEASYGKALQETRSANAPLLVVLDKPSSEETRVKPELLGEDQATGKAELLRPYRLCHVDVTTNYGKKVASAFKATSFPHVAIIDKTGSKVIYRKTGQIQEEEWQEMLTDHRRGEGPVRRAISRLTNKPVDGMLNGGSSRPYCPNCQRNSF